MEQHGLDCAPIAAHAVALKSPRTDFAPLSCQVPPLQAQGTGGGVSRQAAGGLECTGPYRAGLPARALGGRKARAWAMARKHWSIVTVAPARTRHAPSAARTFCGWCCNTSSPKGFRRSRNFGLAHPNCKQRQRLALLRMGLKPSAASACMAPGTPGLPPASTQPPLSECPKLRCRCCGAAMVIVRRRIAPEAVKVGAAGPPGAAREGQMG